MDIKLISKLKSTYVPRGSFAAFGFAVQEMNGAWPAWPAIARHSLATYLRLECRAPACSSCLNRKAGCLLSLRQLPMPQEDGH